MSAAFPLVFVLCPEWAELLARRLVPSCSTIHAKRRLGQMFPGHRGTCQLRRRTTAKNFVSILER